jgi:hypothetical protein
MKIIKTWRDPSLATKGRVGFKTPTKFLIWLLLFNKGSNPFVKASFRSQQLLSQYDIEKSFDRLCLKKLSARELGNLRTLCHLSNQALEI